MSDNVIIIFKNCSVGLRSWCNTYCLQPYAALFVFVFMAATLHSTLPFLKVFIITCFPPFFKIIALSLLLFACTNFSIFEILGFWHY